MPDPSTVLFDRYRVDGVLGEGGQAVVLRVFDQRLDVPRAIKMLFPKVAKRRSLRERFVAEARLLARIEHPNVVRVYDVEVAPPAPYFVAELVTGGSLLDRIRRGPVPPRTVVSLVGQICAGLAAAHASGVVHRDVKPQNVLLTPTGVCKVADFGIAHFEDVGRTKAGVTMGTEGFMSPEQYTDAASVDARADVYGVGMTAYVLLTRRDPVEWLGGRTKGVPEALVPVLLAATAQDRDQRIPSVSELAARLQEAARGLPPEDPGEWVPGQLADDPGLAHRILEVSSWFTSPDPTDSEEVPRPAPPSSPPSRPPRPASAPPTYTMSRPVADRPVDPATYAVGEAPALPTGFEVRLEEDERAASQEARTRRVSEEASGPGTASTATLAPVDGDLVGRAAWWAVVLPRVAAISLVVGTIATGVVVWFWQREEARNAQILGEARVHLSAAVRAEVGVLGALEQLGSDPATMHQLLSAMEDADTDEDRALVAARIVEHVRNETERLAPIGSAQRTTLDQQTAEMVQAAATWERVRAQLER